MKAHAKNTKISVKDKVDSQGDEILGAQFKEFMVSIQHQKTNEYELQRKDSSSDE